MICPAEANAGRYVGEPIVVSTPKIAVLMTLYRRDALDYFELALKSIEEQTGFSGSTRIYLCCDGPLEPNQITWLQDNVGRFYKCIHNDVNVGLAASLNRLIDLLEDEEFVFRMDGDDISLPERFSRQISYMRTYPEIGLVGCQAYDIDEQGRVFAKRVYPTSEESCRRALTSINPVLHPAYCIRREILKNPKVRYPTAYLSEDLAFLVRLLQLGIPIGNAPEFLFQWRVGQNFFARRSSAKRGLVELKWYSMAVFFQDGVISAKYASALARFILRLLPGEMQEFIYRSSLRSRQIK